MPGGSNSVAAVPDVVDAEELWTRLDEYCALGSHRTGTDGDRATLAWFAGELARLGGRVERHPFTFDRYVATSRVTIDGAPVPSDTLYYEGVGDVVSDSPHRAVVAVTSGDRGSPALGDEIAAARASGAEIAVLATEHPLGELVLPNRAPVLGSGMPVVLVPGRDGDRLLAGDVHVELSARIEPGASGNVTASFGPSDGPVLVLATPLSGWFTCAAERATGIAVLLGLVTRLGDRHRIEVVGASGHELLPHVGLAHHLAAADRSALCDPALIVHLGANVALAGADPATGEIVLSPGLGGSTPTAGGRAVFARLGRREAAAASDALAAIDLRPVLDPPQWFGEGALWAAATHAPLVSFVGVSPTFHTPADVAATCASPAALLAVTNAIGDAIDACLTAFAQA